MHIKIVDNFLESSDLELLIEFINKSRRVDKNGLSINKIEDLELVKKLNNTYHIKVMNILQQLFPEKVELYDYTQFALIETGSNFKFPIHDDDPNKILRNDSVLITVSVSDTTLTSSFTVIGGLKEGNWEFNFVK